MIANQANSFTKQELEFLDYLVIKYASEQPPEGLIKKIQDMNHDFSLKPAKRSLADLHQNE